jgi:glutamate-1-semialdehyde 2,1-aminomutase
VRVANLSTVWTVLYTRPSRYNWMLQFYLRSAGLHLSWVGTGRLIFSLAYGESEFATVAERFTAACAAMKADRWWDGPETTDKAIRRAVLKEAARVRLGLAPRA